MRKAAVIGFLASLIAASAAFAQQGETIEISGYVRALRIQRDQAQEAWAQSEGRVDALRAELAKAQARIKELAPEAKPEPVPQIPNSGTGGALLGTGKQP